MTDARTTNALTLLNANVGYEYMAFLDNDGSVTGTPGTIYVNNESGDTVRWLTVEEVFGFDFAAEKIDAR